MSTKTVVNKMTKEQLKEVINLNFKAVSKVSKEVKDSISYTSKVYKENPKSVTKKDFLDLVKDIMETLGDKFVLTAPETPVAENSVKPKKLKKNKEEAPAEKIEEEEKAPAKEETKKAPNKKAEKKSAPKKKGVELKVNDYAKVFPKELDYEVENEEGKKVNIHYELASDIETMEDLYKAITEDGQKIVFALMWTPHQLRMFDYFSHLVPITEKPKEFENDLDLADVVYVSDEYKVAYVVSLYSEGCYAIAKDEIEEFDGIRASAGMEYQIYRVIE